MNASKNCLSRLYLLGLMMVVVVLFSGCASHSTRFQALEKPLKAGQLDAALAALEKQHTPRHSRVLYWLDKAMLLRMKGDYQGSNQAFEAAKQGMAALDATSLREQAASVTINETLKAFQGEDFEQVMVHFYMALNYLALNQLDDARVEALQVDERLNVLADSGRSNQVYAEDALSRYLTGVIYESLGEWSNAMIAYRLAYQAYQKQLTLFSVEPPSMLKVDLLRMSQYLGLSEEYRGYKKRFGDIAGHTVSERKDLGELFFLFHNDLAPVKREHFIESPYLHRDGYMTMAHISVPYYEPRNVRVARVRLILRSDVREYTTETELAENINLIAQGALSNNMPGIVARSIARLVLKQKVRDEALEHNPMLGFIADVAGIVTERADTRSWLTLPNNIQMARLEMMPGRYQMKLEFLDRSGAIIKVKKQADIVVSKRKITHVSQHMMFD